MRLDYLELPLYLRLYHPLHVNLHFYLDAGGYVATLLGLEGRVRGHRYALEIRHAHGLRAIQADDDTIKNTSLTLAASLSL